MQSHLSFQAEVDPDEREVYTRALRALEAAGVPFLVGGAYAFGYYTGIARHTKDFDIFVRRADVRAAFEALAAEGFETELTFPHWLGKAYCGENFIDVIFGAGNGVAAVDDAWFEQAIPGEVFGLPVRICPVEEMIWSKAFIMERERFDGADVAHLLLARGENLDWDHLLASFGPHWRVLLAHLVLFGFIYPGERSRIPRSVLGELIARLEHENQEEPDLDLVCRGTLLSRAQYLVDLEQWGYHDGRLQPRGNLTAEEIAGWTEAIESSS